MSYNDLTARLGVNLNAEVSSKNSTNTSSSNDVVVQDSACVSCSGCGAIGGEVAVSSESDLEPQSNPSSLTLTVTSSATAMAANSNSPIGELKQKDEDFQKDCECEDVDNMILKNMPAGEIGRETVRSLTQYLRPPHINAKDWEDMAEEMGFNYQREIKNFALERNPVESVIVAWSTKRGSTIGKLLEILETIERDDVLRVLPSLLVNDYKRWKKRQEEANSPVQDPEVSESYPVQLTTEELRGITVGDHPSGPPEMFDAYVCFDQADLEFVMELIKQLESPPHNFKLCIEPRDLVPHGSHATVTAEIIQNRCKKMLVILSPEFLRSPNCTFQTRFAVSLEPGARTRRIIPILVKPCTLPSIIRHITVCDFTKRDLRQWLWSRLGKAISLP